MINTIVAAVMAMSTVVVPSAVTPPPGAVTIDVVTVNGSGCSPGTAAVEVSPDHTAFIAIYSNYLAAVGVGARPTDFRKFCQLNLRVNVPQGFAFAIDRVDYRGFAHLERGATGTLRGNYSFQGMPETMYKSHTWQGPLSDNWQATDTVDIELPVIRPCEPRNLNINTELRVNAGTSDPKTTTSFMSMDPTDAFIATVYHFAWRRCP
ncbi:hypothetical protein JOF56_009690 [Kibdelosporangium banguiense]|uniref:DUF4360 domain-containing protein n=1 Tax=Kibdelosporangium banguiense TaxID=1365924 RepID=A0ABS4TY20_9PSEU|nr:DUF4360 domain-containing protein [Kibdelosporangium banguiense]MBP2329305.1 hypothetical protein [Kibdelosporangium banguiense]